MIIYKIENLINGKIYIGQTIKSLSNRVSEHIKSNSYIGNALRKYGIQSFVTSVIDEADTKEILKEKEKYWIKTLDCKAPNGYNLTDGGDGAIGVFQSEETRRKRSETLKGRPRPDLSERNRNNKGKPAHNKGIPMLEEQKLKISKTLVGRKRTTPIWNKGLTKETDERVKQMGENYKGHTVSEETKKKISLARKGHTLSDESKQKLSDKLKGRVFTEVWKQKISDSCKKRHSNEKYQ
jgi:group I intron endonuclease